MSVAERLVGMLEQAVARLQGILFTGISTSRYLRAPLKDSGKTEDAEHGESAHEEIKGSGVRLR